MFLFFFLSILGRELDACDFILRNVFRKLLFYSLHLPFLSLSLLLHFSIPFLIPFYYPLTITTTTTSCIFFHASPFSYNVLEDRSVYFSFVHFPFPCLVLRSYQAWSVNSTLLQVIALRVLGIITYFHFTFTQHRLCSTRVGLT